MAAICTQSISPNNCGHRIVTITLDGVPHTFESSDYEVIIPLTAEETETFLRLALRRMRSEGVTLAQLLGRVTIGDEATNVKCYSFFGPGAAVTKTNIGTAYVNILPGLNGERSLIDFTGCTEFRVILTANLVGTGPFGARIVRDSDSTVLYENAAIAVTGERELDTDWQTVPAGFTGIETLRVQAKSVTAADDPVFRALRMLVR